MSELYSELRWLPPPPADFSLRLLALENTTDPLGNSLRTLATHALDLNQLNKLSKFLLRSRARGRSLAPLQAFKLAVLSNSTVDHIVPALIASGIRRGFDLEVIQPSYDQVAQEALAPDSTVNGSKPDAVLFALDHRAVPLTSCFGDAEGSANAVNAVIAYLQTLQSGIRKHSAATCVFQTMPPPAEALFGSLDGLLPGTLRTLLAQVNHGIAEFARRSGDVVLDVAALAETVGLSRWHDPPRWHMAKFAFSDEFVPLYADHVARTLAAMRGRSGKVLILDLDNTVWGGVIGDDGLEGIRLAQGDPIGEAHLDLQRFAMELRKRGIVLAVSSKNSDEIARQPFEKHPEMLLKLEHIAVFQANWNDKAANIRAIAKELSLGLDAMVFVDDNPVERGLVRQLLPDVAVPELPEDPSLYVRTLAAGGYFESIALAVEDLNRADFYQDNARRATLQQQSGDLSAYLASLDMTITFRPFDAMGRARIVQLINKSNQYNLTTIRHSEADVAAAENDPHTFTLQVRLKDKFGDNGMISVVICRRIEPAAWTIDTWLMSCRVLGRHVERMVLREILRHARLAGVRVLHGVYKPTDRNALVSDHYSRLGFTKIDASAAGDTFWELSVGSADPPPAPMTVVTEGFPDVSR